MATRIACYGPSLDCSMFDYEPYRGGENRKHKGDSQTLNYIKIGYNLKKERKEKFLDDVFDWLKSYCEEYRASDLVIAIAPGHKATDDPSGFMHDIVGELLDESKFSAIIDGREMLVRTKSIDKQSKSQGKRSAGVHKGTIGISSSFEVEDVKGKTVLILDDVWTSGGTLSECRKVVMDNTKPEEVKLLAIGKTVPAD